MATIIHKGSDNNNAISVPAGDILMSSPNGAGSSYFEGTVECDVAAEFSIVSEVIDTPGTFKVIEGPEVLTPDKMELIYYKVTQDSRIQIENVTGGPAVVKLKFRTQGHK